MIGRRIGPHAESAFVESLRRGHIAVEPLEDHDWNRIDDLVRRYVDLPLGLVDASVVATAERLGAARIATLDHRHFTVVRPRHRDAFELVS